MPRYRETPGNFVVDTSCHPTVTICSCSNEVMASLIAYAMNRVDSESRQVVELAMATDKLRQELRQLKEKPNA